MSYMNSIMLTVATACFAVVLYIKMMLRRQTKKSMLLPALLPACLAGDLSFMADCGFKTGSRDWF